MESTQAGDRVFCTGLFLGHLQQEKKDHQKTPCCRAMTIVKFEVLIFLSLLHQGKRDTPIVTEKQYQEPLLAKKWTERIPKSKKRTNAEHWFEM